MLHTKKYTRTNTGSIQLNLFQIAIKYLQIIIYNIHQIKLINKTIIELIKNLYFISQVHYYYWEAFKKIHSNNSRNFGKAWSTFRKPAQVTSNFENRTMHLFGCFCETIVKFEMSVIEGVGAYSIAEILLNCKC